LEVVWTLFSALLGREGEGRNSNEREWDEKPLVCTRNLPSHAFEGFSSKNGEDPRIFTPFSRI
jgi:hypothetical protein